MGKLMLFWKDGKSWCFGNGEISVSAMVKLVFQQQEKEMLLLKKNRKMLLKDSMRRWIMN